MSHLWAPARRLPPRRVRPARLARPARRRCPQRAPLCRIRDHRGEPAMTLTPDHLTQLATRRGIAEAVISERGYRTCTGHSELKSLGIAARKAEAQGLLLPLWSVD